LLNSWPETWQRCYAAFLQSIFDLSGSEASRADYHSTLTRFFRFCNKLPDAVSRADVIDFVQSPATSKRCPGKEVAASTKNIRLCAIKSFYSFASAYEIDQKPLYEKALPTTGIRYLKRPIAYRAMNAEELERFFNAIPNTLKGARDRAMFFMYFVLGRRRSELYKLQWKDIESTVLVDENGVRRPSHVYRYFGKGHARQVRTKELPEAAWNALCNYLDQAGRLATMQPDDYLFVSVTPGSGLRGSVHGSIGKNRPLNHNTVNVIFRQYCRAAGLDLSRLSLHSLRHTSAHLRYEAGEDIRSIQQLLDHSSLQTTDIYLRTRAGVSDKGAKALTEKYGHFAK